MHSINAKAPEYELTKERVQVPVVAIGGIKGLGAKVSEMIGMVATNVKQVVLDDRGHFMPEQCPGAVENEILALRERVTRMEFWKETAETKVPS